MNAENQQERLNDQWISGFVDGEGCFLVGFNDNQKLSLGVQVLPEIRVVQNLRDRVLLTRLKNHFDCGVVRRNSSVYRHTLQWSVRKKIELLKLIKHFKEYPLQSKKKKDFEKFCEVISLLDSGLTPEKLELIKKIKITMNKGAKYNDDHLESSETKR